MSQEFKEDKTLKKLEKQGYTDVEFKKIKKSSYNVAGTKALDGGSFNTIDSTIKNILKNMKIL